MKAQLVFLPFCSPTFIPYHLCELAGYLMARGFKDIEILDLNIHLFNKQFGGLESYNRIVSGEWDNYMSDSYLVAEKWNVFQVELEQKLVKYLETGIDFPLEVDLNKLADIVCISWTFHHRGGASQFYSTMAFVKYIKEKCPEKIVILGGSYLNHIDKKQLMMMFPEIDYVLHRESEESLFCLLKQLAENSDVFAIPNLFYRNSGKIIKTEEVDNVLRGLVFEPNFDGIEINKYFNPSSVVSIQYKRGCDWNKCTFCSHNNMYFPSVDANKEGFIKKAEFLYGKGVNFLFLADQMITFDDVGFLNSVLAGKFYWACMIMPQEKITATVLEEMYQAGCRWICWGVESASPRILKLMKKPVVVEAAKRNIIDAHIAGIQNVVLMMQGFPSETEEDLALSMNFLKELRPYYYDNSLSPFHVCYGSEVQKNPEKFGIEELSSLVLYKNENGVLSSELYAYSPMKEIKEDDNNKRSIPFAEHMLIASSLFKKLGDVK